MSDQSDADLRELFQDLRQHERAATPAFESVLSHVSTRALRRGPVLAWTAGGLVLVAAAGLFLILRPPPTALDAAAVAPPPWRSPTDFLLAGAGESLQSLSWTPSPTSGLGQPSFNRIRENQ